MKLLSSGEPGETPVIVLPEGMEIAAIFLKESKPVAIQSPDCSQPIVDLHLQRENFLRAELLFWIELAKTRLTEKDPQTLTEAKAFIHNAAVILENAWERSVKRAAKDCADLAVETPSSQDVANPRAGWNWAISGSLIHPEGHVRRLGPNGEIEEDFGPLQDIIAERDAAAKSNAQFLEVIDGWKQIVEGERLMRQELELANQKLRSELANKSRAQ